MKVGIVAFSNEPRSPSGCLGNKVTRATAENKNIIHQFLDTVTPKSKILIIVITKYSFCFLGFCALK